jgi:hypothetical protein
MHLENVILDIRRKASVVDTREELVGRYRLSSPLSPGRRDPF